MCSYTGRHFGAPHDDAYCSNGTLMDIDGDGVPSDIPCPSCNTAAFLDDAKQQAEQVNWGQSGFRYFNGATIITGAVRVAQRVNPRATAAWKQVNATANVTAWPDQKAVLEGRASPDETQEMTLSL